MKRFLLICVALVVGFFVVAVIVGIISAVVQNERVNEEVADATSQVVIETPAGVGWKATIGGMEQAGTGAATLDVPNSGTGKAKEFRAVVEKTTRGDHLLTVILKVDGEQSVRESTRDYESEIQVSTTLSVE